MFGGFFFPERFSEEQVQKSYGMFLVKKTDNQHFCSAGSFVRALREDWHICSNKKSVLSEHPAHFFRQKGQRRLKILAQHLPMSVFPEKKTEFYDQVIWKTFPGVTVCINMVKALRSPAGRNQPNLAQPRSSKIFGRTALFAYVRDKSSGTGRSLILTTCKP